MSIYYTLEQAKLVMEDRLREAGEVHESIFHCCEEIAVEEPKSSKLSLFSRLQPARQSPAACSC
jgi:hypothetical protein